MQKADTTAQLVKEEILRSAYTLESLKRGLINYSELARQLLPKIKAKNRKANFPSTLIAIQRFYDEIKHTPTAQDFTEILKDSEIIMKTDVIDISLERTAEVMRSLNSLSGHIRWDMGDIMFIVQGTSEVTVIVDKKNLSKLDPIKSYILKKKDGLALLSLREPDNLSSYSKGLSGFLAYIMTSLADRNINIWEVATTYKQNLFVLSKSDLPIAYEVLQKLIDSKINGIK